ncbi:uncharacterized protein VNE69_09129 [Vairimorpha necatrix]|uniref:Uncharacterized protein n=1 Tax=Vairimorpha necatrix TaxID=6039 RepID=A0AAX4JFD7_9MICR
MNCINGRNFKEKFSSLDYSNTLHILWIYKNIPEIEAQYDLVEVISRLKEVVIKDYTYGILIYEDISNLVLKHYEDNILSKCISDYFFDFCTPIMDVCLKQVVDVFTYIYKKIKDFTNIDKLIEKYQERKDIFIELNILKIRLNHKYVTNTASDSILNKFNLTSGSTLSGINELIENMHIKEDKNKDIKDIKDINNEEDKSSSSLLIRSLLDYENLNLNFFIENACIFLTYKDDSTLLTKLIKYSKSGYKHLIIKNISPSLYIKLKDHLEMNEEILKKGIYDYKYFLKWCNTSFTTLSILKINDFIDISDLLVDYYEEDKREMNIIIKRLLDLNIQSIKEKIRINILKNIERYIIDDDTIRHLVLDCSKYKVYKKILVKKMGIIKYFKEVEREEFIKNLFTEFDLDWRYRRTLMEECMKNKVGEKYLEIFKDDKVYAIREFYQQKLCDKDVILIEGMKDKEDIVKDYTIDTKEVNKDYTIDTKEVIDKEDIIKEDSIKEDIVKLEDNNKEDSIKEEDTMYNKEDNKEDNNKDNNKEDYTIDNNNKEDILEKRPLVSSKEDIFKNLKNNVKNKIKNIEEKIIFINENNL